MAKRRLLKGTLVCTTECGHKVPITLMESNQGVYKCHEYICANCNSPMIMEVADEEQ